MYFRPDYNIDMESVLQSVATDVLLLLPEDVDEQIVTNIWRYTVANETLPMVLTVFIYTLS